MVRIWKIQQGWLRGNLVRVDGEVCGAVCWRHESTGVKCCAEGTLV